jgi:hypothetical protein
MLFLLLDPDVVQPLLQIYKLKYILILFIKQIKLKKEYTTIYNYYIITTIIQ